MIKELVTIIIFFAQTFFLFGQSKPELILSKGAALEDISILKASMYEIHPSIFRYTTRSDFEQEFNQIINSIPDSVSVFQFTSLVVPIVAKIRCGHTFPLVPYFASEAKALPLEIKIIDNKVFVIENLSSKSEPSEGSELLEINGMPILTLLEILRNKEVADGFVMTTKD